MGTRQQRRTRDYYYFLFRLFLLVFLEDRAFAQIRYSVPEEVRDGTVVGNVAKDLGLEMSTLTDRRFRVVSGSKEAFFEVNRDNGALYVHRKIDREELCQGSGACVIELKILVENPLEMHHIVVEINDINDHSPTFPEINQTFEIAEHTLPGKQFQLHAARDPDAGVNSIRTYTLTTNEHFEVDIRQSDEDKVPFLVLKKSLDREQKDKHTLLLTAVDGGKPQRSGTLNVTIIVLDINDNRPMFNQEIYQVEIQENVPVGTSVFRINATDPDEGANGEVEYNLGKTLKKKVYDIFELDKLTGEITVKGLVDFEENDVYKLDVEASDKGTPPLTGECRVIIKLRDVNDNPPEIEVTSLSNKVPEDSKPGTIISLLSVSDKDSGVNGKIITGLTSDPPFDLKPSYKENIYSIVTKGLLDREQVSHYEITIKATDCGDPPLSTFKTLSIQISDVNDNRPHFQQNPLQFYLVENNVAGASIFSVSATDNDVSENAAISYHIVREGRQNDVTSFLNVNSENGHITALKSFDFETVKTFQFQVVASDSGTPSLSSNVTVNVFILDQNDNAPVILYPVSSNGSAEGVEEIPRNVNAGHLVTKVRAYDADIGYNGWLLFSLQEVTEHNLFSLDRYTGQIRTLRSFTETDEAEQKLIILVKDNGNVSLSATATVIVKVVESKEAFAASDVKSATKEDEESNVTFYLMITLASVSALFIISIIVLIAMQCSKSTDYTSKYLQETNYDGTLCHSIQYRSGDKRYMFVGPRMSIGSTIVPGSHANTLVLPDRRRASTEFQVVASDSGTPSLSSNVTVNVFILDQNDNAPVILYPVSSNGSAEGVEEIPRNVNARHLVTKVRAYDADIGYNGWLLFSLQEVTEHNLFALDRYTGQIRTLRSFTETDEAEQKLIILVKDNGNVSLSATATVIVKVVEPKEAFAASDVKSATKDDEESNVTFYLMITLASVSALFIISIIVLIAMQCSKSTDYTSKYLQETNYDGTLCHSIQYRSGDKRYMLVGPRMSIGSTIVPGSHANTLVLPDRRRASTERHSASKAGCDLAACACESVIDTKTRTMGSDCLAFCLSLLMLFGTQASAQIRYSIPEEVKEGTVVGNVAKDLGLDITSLNDRRFRVVSGSKETIFEVNQNNGALYVHSHIDREELCQGSGTCLMELKILVENPLEIHYVIVEITDVNDHSPSFPEKEQIFKIAEHTLPGRRFQLHTARDPDAGINSIRTYTLTTNEHFEVNIRQGDAGKIPFLVLKKSLDREQKDKHTLLLTAVDGGKPQRSGTLNVTIIVLDINDNRPMFSQEIYQIEIQENVPVGTSVFRMNATDPDEGTNGEVEYSLGKTLSPKVYDIFELDKITGEVRVHGVVNYEEKDLYELDIEASDKASPPLTGECRVIIKIKDVNDNPPEIEVTSLSNTVPEDSKPGTIVSLLSVKDKDSGVNGKVILQISNDVPFELKPSYKENTYSVVTKGILDREQVSDYEITIKATDCGDPPLSTYKTLSIQISDVNDNRPHFQQNPLQFYLVENNVAGASIFSVSATDNDVSENAAISYHIVREGSQNDVTSFLNVNSENGHITALKSFDFETVKKFQFQVVASDSGTPSLSSNVTVNVFILDQNDNAPVILYPVSSNGSAEGVEEIPRNVNAGHLVTKVRAYDADIGYNGWLLFSLQEVTEHNLFSLDRYTGQIRTLRSFTETDEAEQKLIILVKDNGNVSLSATATVIVKVVEPKEAFAASDVKSATKEDEESNVTFYLMITLASVSALFIISIIVLIAMQCSKSTDYTSKYLQETNYDGTLCHSIQYRSGDKRYMLVGPRMSIGSTIVPGSHANTLVLPDRRRASTETKDKGRMMYWSRPLLFSLLFSFGELILAQIKYSTPEEVTVGTIIGNVAKDLGLEVSSLINRRFRIVSGAQDTLFEVNPNNGVLYVHKNLDREQMCDRNSACMKDLKIVVENPLEIHYVTVEITDANDHAPTFVEKEKVIEIAENTLPGARFQLPGARDPDVGVNSVQRYRLSQNEHFNLEIREREDDKIPFLVLQRQLDREQKRNHSLILTAIDGGTPPKSAKLNLTIKVLDTNDNRPTFTKEVYSVTLQENVALDTFVLKVNATDLDEGTNGDIEFAFGDDISLKILEIFSINRNTGEIRVKGQIDYEASDVFKLNVQASDRGQPPMTTDCRVIIKIQDVNDNKPEIEVTSISNMVPEDSKLGTVISLISITDNDSGLNGKVKCTLTGDVPFELKPSFKENMYSLVTRETLDRETMSHYEISITATDLGDPPLSAVKTLSIEVSDVNDNIPEFSQSPLELYLKENNNPGESIFSVSAVDKDLNDNARVSYRITRGGGGQNDMASFLNINSENGQITALRSFDFETVKKFQFQVVASDSGTPSLSSNVTVNVFILDQNDNAPVILYPVSSNGSAEGVEEIPRNVNAGHLVTKVRAYDADIGYNGWLLFSLQEVTEHNLFSLDRYTGQIRTLRSFTETDEAEQKLIILVKDNGNVSLSATATVIVKVVEPKEAFAASDVKSATKDDEESNVTFYLMITLASVSALFIISIIVLIAMQCSKSTDYTSKYLQETNYDGTLCHSIQYRSGDKRYMLVGPRMSIGSTIVPGSHANTLVLPDRRRASTEVSLQENISLLYTKTRTMGSDCLGFYFALLMLFGTQASAQIRYSIPEEVKEGTVVGNVAKDLGLDITSLNDRRFRVVSGSKETIFEVNQNNGALYVHSHIDREELCQGSGTCLMELKILVENPLEIHYVIVEIIDVNDHSPSFPENEQIFKIAEHTLPGRRFELDTARDPDAGINSIRTYTLTTNEHFELDIRQSDEDKIPFLVLKKSLDREQKDKHTLLLTAVDGGKPQRSGTSNVTIIVLDSNDNRPMFNQEIYQIEIQENVPVGTLILRINATDPDEGSNGLVEYSLEKSLRRKSNTIFELDKLTGEIKVKGLVDFEENNVYKLDVEASDKASPPLTGECKVIIKVKDINDNPPEIEVTSLSNTVPEDSKPGTIISLLSVSDKDSGVNGKIILQILNDVPFELKPSYKENIYSVVTKNPLDREQVSHYEITIKATDCGDPPLSTFKTLNIQILDVNDNRPLFEQNPLQFYLVENNVAGGSIFSVSATDNDVSENAAISYHIVREGSQNDVTSFLNVNSENGHITALKSFDFETVKTFQFQVVASDSGTPSLSSNVTVNVFILDQNDNAPVILYPVSSNGSAEGVEEIPRNVNAGHLVTKVRAYDADIGYNGWLLFSLQEVTEHNLFALDRYTGQIRTLRSFTETDEAEQKLIILVKDNGNVSLSATATVIVKVVEPKEAFAASDVKSATKDDEESNVTFYLMITLASVSALFIISIIVLIAMQCSKSTDYTSKYLQETNYDGTLCHSIQYRSGDKRYMLVGPRMSIGSTIVPGSHANTLVLPDRRRASTE
ncbi:protocadherin Fat 4-like [Notolabrus celidotus]|uniref:protocadherin Fat 4-like n=1 Tax=Notolabrus celidotus TaxID=1203425 RepID=UPI00148F6579|nr:protocadherin Fat 4-like [Notolabrus celidotus]